MVPEPGEQAPDDRSGGRSSAADRVTASPVLLPVLGSSIPISPYVTTVSFVRYAGCAAVAAPV